MHMCVITAAKCVLLSVNHTIFCSWHSDAALDDSKCPSNHVHCQQSDHEKVYESEGLLDDSGVADVGTCPGCPQLKEHVVLLLARHPVCGKK